MDNINDLYKLLIKKDKEKDLLESLLKWAQSFLDENKSQVYYFTLPIWDYTKNSWKEPTYLSVSKQNDGVFQNEEGWYSYIGGEKIKEGLAYTNFFNEAKQTGFTFVGFITQEIKSVRPILQIEFNDKNNFDFSDENYILKCDVLDRNKKVEFVNAAKSALENNIKNPSETNKELEKFFDFLWLYKQHFTDLRYIYLISSRLFSNTNNDLSSGGLILVCKDKIDDKKLQLLSIAVNLCYREVGGKNWEEKSKIEAIKSAVAAIMSRNMSHNLGSHDISNTKNYFGRRINDKCFYSNQVKDEDLVLYRSDYRGNVRLLQYIQERMDFIATIVSTDHYPFGPLNFKAEFFDILTNDDCGERHNKPERNFLLLYLLYSEKYTRINVNLKEDYGNVRLEVIDKDGCLYTGLGKEKNAERRIKTKLSKLLLAVPGGVMSRHALFTIVENILRNSAKHNEHVEEIVLTIKVKEGEDGKVKLSFYDNCGSANEKMFVDNGKEIKVLENIKRKLENIIVIDNNGVINKHDKGLKEMLICALWLQNKDVAETLFNIQNGNDNATKYLEVGTEGENLCYTVTLEKFEPYHVIKPGSNQKVSEAQLLNIHADFILSDKDYTVGHTRLSDIFPRFFRGEWNDVYNEIEKTNGNYSLVVEINLEGIQLPSGVVLRDEQGNLGKDKKRICFYDHLTNKGKQSDIDAAKEDKNIVYLDSISGENFTSTLVTPDFLKDEVSKYKVIQSALTRIAILDERIWNNYRSGCKITSKSDKLQYQNALNALTGVDSINDVLTMIKGINQSYYKEVNSHKEVDDVTYLKWLRKSLHGKIDFVPDITCQLLEKRNIFVYTIENGKLIGLDGNEVEEAPNFDFVTVHLGLVEKLPDNSGGFETFLEKHGIRAMGYHRPFVSIHSGRGNFSPELEESLKNYPFLSLSAVESALNNSKYLLSELFFNTNYYGKGNINHK